MNDCQHVATDTDLLAAVRAGNRNMFGELYTRYHRWAGTVARNTTARFDSADIVAEAFTRILRAINSGHGPTAKFSSYLATTIRSVAATWGARVQDHVHIPLDETIDEPVEVEFTISGDLGELTNAFNSLTLRWKQVLWLTIIDGFTLARTAQIMGMTEGAANQLAARARAGLRSAVAREQDAFTAA